MEQDSGEPSGDRDIELPTGQLRVSGMPIQPTVESANETLRYRLTDACSAQIAFNGPVTQAAVDKLVKLLELSKDAFPETTPPQPHDKPN